MVEARFTAVDADTRESLLSGLVSGFVSDVGLDAEEILASDLGLGSDLGGSSLFAAAFVSDALFAPARRLVRV